MSQSSTDLVDRQYITLVMRLVVTRRGELIGGQLLDASGSSIGRFDRLEQVAALAEASLTGKTARGHDAAPQP